MNSTKSFECKKIISKLLFIIIGILLAVYALIIIAMFVWAFYISLETSTDYAFSSYRFPANPTFDNYLIAFRELKIQINVGIGTRYVKIPMMIVNSLIYAGGCGLVSTVVPCIVAYCCARYKYRFGKIIYASVIFAMSVPIIGAQVSELRVLQALNLYDTFLGMFILKTNYLGIYFLVYFAAFKSLPLSYVEAAKIDGANEFTVFFKIMFPLVIGTSIAILLMKVIEFWNDIAMSRIYLPSKPTLAYGMLYFSVEVGNLSLLAAGAPVRIAACMILVLPMLLLYLLLHKKMLGNMTIGGVKG